MANYLGKQQILDAADRKFADVEVPEWGGTIRLASLDAHQSLKMEELNKRLQAGEAVDPIGPLLVASIVDEKGEPLFTEENLAALGKKSPAVLIRLATEVGKLNRASEASAGNSEPSPSAS